MISVEEARALYPRADAAHDFDHVLRVWAMARRIAAAEGADTEIVEAAALLHDTGRAEESATGRSHAAISAERARLVLAGQAPALVESVAAAIASHSFRAGLRPETLEAQVLYDADKLDSIGAIGIARAYAIAGLCGQRLWAEVEEGYLEKKLGQTNHQDLTSSHSPVHEYAYKLSRVGAGLFTGTGRRIAAGRHEFMVAYFRQLEREVRGEV
jgi:uncharacterized protein